MNAAPFLKQLRQSHALKRELHRYTYSLMTQITQTAACNRFHDIEARLARWLLMTHDRVQSSSFRLTQEFLAQMLGVRRVGVTKAARTLQKDGLISYSRGHYHDSRPQRPGSRLLLVLRNCQGHARSRVSRTAGRGRRQGPQESGRQQVTGRSKKDRLVFFCPPFGGAGPVRAETNCDTRAPAIRAPYCLPP